MTDKNLNNDLRFASLKNEATRQRWEMFHRAIALAKQSNAQAMEKEQSLKDSLDPASGTVRQRAEPLLSIAR
ncbi:MAG TPA: hypothetical protein VKZ91_06385 [Woeseiaceae bacterium]|nr:hypothetical protein [Woeseiaceae bacterium]